MVFDILIKNGQVFDGSGISGLNIDIGINQGKIAKLGNLKIIQEDRDKC